MNTKIIEVWIVFLFSIFIIGDGVVLMTMAVNPENTVLLAVLGAVVMFIGGYASQLAFGEWRDTMKKQRWDRWASSTSSWN